VQKFIYTWLKLNLTHVQHKDKNSNWYVRTFIIEYFGVAMKIIIEGMSWYVRTSIMESYVERMNNSRGPHKYLYSKALKREKVTLIFCLLAVSLGLSKVFVIQSSSGA
jgi:hypothetical protein